MNVSQFLELLRKHPDHTLSFVLPDGSSIPPHYHITEVGHATKTFLDCGGKSHRSESCILQSWIADDVDHRLHAGKLVTIFDRAAELITDQSLPVELEHEAPVLTQLTIGHHKVLPNTLEFHLEHKKTDCLAKDICLPDFTLPAIPGQSACSPATGCC
ncbi:DUF6428 family protein [Haloferula sp.]|uniref:DUF6428 family protein n=1 Tax=Haloferula sp. TaxID=2497595 RepID=UPI0032A0F622